MAKSRLYREKESVPNSKRYAIGYIDTTLGEFMVDYLSGDHPSGHIIRFANAKVFTEYVYNYSWPLFPFFWSDFKFASDAIKRIVETEIGEAMVRRAKRFKHNLADAPCR